MTTRTSILVAIAATLLFLGCATSGGGGNVQYGDAQAIETTTIGFGSTDLQMIAEKMVDSLLTFPPIVQMTTDRRPVVFVEKVKNKTMEHIDTESITDTISTKLLRSGKFRFVDMTKVDAVREQLEYQNESGMVDPSKAVAFGRQIGAEFMVYGNFSSIEKRDKRVRDLYYKFTLKMMNLETGIVEWMDEKEIRKTSKRSLVGG
ncbi:MAG TPA: penicillin-binding protein activator LpoB [Candidatus Hydrogenedentes bacterium]|nr:penicillin-binding protein activator LpoB [Candidatus Hydrogenedentota bacterium]